jgi:hypothetical protein
MLRSTAENHFSKVFPVLLSHCSEFLQVIQNFRNTKIVKWDQIRVQILLQSVTECEPQHVLENLY